MLSLDIGCGKLKLGDVNVDISRDVEPDVIADGCHLPFKNWVFGKVFCSEVIEHVENPLLLLREAYRVLMPNGTLVLSTPNPYLWIRFLKEIFTGKPRVEPSHIIAFTKSELKSIIEKAGFKVAYIEYRNSPWYLKRRTPKKLSQKFAFALEKFLPDVLSAQSIFVVAVKKAYIC
ncbi:MAG: methyltransferase domain-containing protein [Candidatus Bathyarchaeia archaeon]